MTKKLPRVRVAFCVRDLKVGGVESVLTRTLEKLEKHRNLEIVVITYTPIRDVWRDWFAAHDKISVRVLYPCKFFGTDLPHFVVARLVRHMMRDIYRGIRRVLFVKRVFRDIDIAVDYYDFDCARELKKLKIPRIAWWHSSSDKFYGGGYVGHLANYDKFVVLTDAFANQLREKYPNFSDKILRIYNPIDVDAVLARAENAPVRDGKYFVCVSRLVNGKGIETVIRAFDKFYAKNHNPDVKLVIVGDGYKMDELKSVARECGSGSHIDFMGEMKNPFGVMRGAIANILSSRGEGLPTVLVEAATMGVLNIASDCKCGPREILMDGRAGRLFPVGDVDALARTMDDVFNGNVDVNKMVATATKNLGRFDADTIVKQIYELLI